LRVHPSGKAVLKIGSKTQGQGHETTFAQIVTHELGIPADDILVQHGDTDNTPFGMGTYASRSTPTAGAATAMVARKVRAKAKKLAAHLLEVSEEDVEWELGRFYVRSAPNRGVSITDCAFAAYTNMPNRLDPDRMGDPALRAVRGRYPLAPPPHRVQGHRGVRLRGRPRRLRQRRHRRHRPPRGPEHRHALPVEPCLGSDQVQEGHLGNSPAS